MVNKSRYFAEIHGINYLVCAPVDTGNGPELSGPYAQEIAAIQDDDAGFLAWAASKYEKEIDIAAESARTRLVSFGPWTHAEYLLAYEDAMAYKAAGYTGQAHGGVTTWAVAQGWTDQQAADDIIYQRALWKAASDQIRGIRLQGKVDVSQAATVSERLTIAQATIAQLNSLFGA